MNLWFFASFLTICFVVKYVVGRAGSAQKDAEKNFWERESRANCVRKKSLDSLDYITIPDKILQLKHTDEEVNSYLADLQKLAGQPIVNLTGQSNTDLKLAYGTANITVLSEYDARYATMVTVLQKLAYCLIRLGEKDTAKMVLEYAISTGSDVSATYLALAAIYEEEGNIDGLDDLTRRAEGLHSLMKGSILRGVRERRSHIAQT